VSQRPELALNGSLAGVECGKLLIDDRVQVFREQLWIAMIQAHGLTNAAVRRIIWDPLFSRDPLPSRPFQEAGCQKSFRLRAIMFKAYRSIQEADITVERLRSLLETAVIDVEVDEEGDLYLTGSGVEFPIFVRLDSDRKMIQLFTYIRKTAIHAATVALRNPTCTRDVLCWPLP
jgi:hypothetical protein